MSALRKLAVTVCLPFKVMAQVGALPVQAPLQLSMAAPLPGAAVRVTLVPCLNVALHVEGQLIPLGELVTAPDPEPERLIVKVAFCGGGVGGLLGLLLLLPLAAWQPENIARPISSRPI